GQVCQVLYRYGADAVALGANGGDCCVSHCCLFSRIGNSMLVSIVGMALYTGYVFMPQHIMAILHYFEIVQ
ncbi:PREDICTED: serine palmitoyltransferase small subunit A, partial [Pterocles gutturalis]|uniref:serine palmitoyltransferase small subunit A n=1 Tax=Pterocles gutturalis TaxID=240206 RepID=UPI0005290F57